jgi:dihydrofolate synthase/folylpolyglutamate synthase
MTQEIAYQDALDYLYSFVDYSLTRSFRNSPEKFDLGRMAVLLERLGNPHRGYPTIHIAGTKGKGSAAAMCASVLQEAGYKTGLYISPHMTDYAERIQVNGETIPHDTLATLVNEIKPYVEQIPQLTTFELTTALAFQHFAQEGVEAAVIEVGLGGRLDATNVIDPLLSIITSISLDHVNVLGDTLGKIAYEKAGIIKPGRPVVSAPQKEPARLVIEQVAAERNSPLVQVGKDFLYQAETHSLDGQTFSIWPSAEFRSSPAGAALAGEEAMHPQRLTIPLLGLHQVENAATAFAALQIARHTGMEIPDGSISKGMEKVSWPGRFELLHHDPPLIVDSAHNQDSAVRLKQALDDYLPGRPVIVIFGASEDKDVPGMLTALKPRIDQLIATQSIHPRAMDAGQIVEVSRGLGIPATEAIPLEAAMVNAMQAAGKEAAVLVTGSLFVAAGARDVWHSWSGSVFADRAGLLRMSKNEK